MPSTTTWSFERGEPLSLARRYAGEEGTVLLYSADGVGISYLALFPDQKIEIPLGPNCWEALEKQVEDALYFGFLSFEMGCYSDPLHTPHRTSATPAALFYRPTVVVKFDHACNKATLFGAASLQRALSSSPFLGRFCASSESLSSYLEKVHTIHQAIDRGEVYQVNFAQRLLFETQGDPFSLFERCCHSYPYAAFVRAQKFSLVSASPELFLQREGDLVTTAPIKGTAPRGKTPQEEKERRSALLNSKKERAELMMIADLMHNDLARLCHPIDVEELCSLHAFPHLFHLVAHLRGWLRKEVHSVALLRTLFPGGSISGCPKLSALQLITQLEEEVRGPYTGAIGFIDGRQRMHFNMAIRTAVVREGEMQLHLGSAIVADSNPLAEYEETLQKGSAFFRALECDVDCLSR